MTFAPAIIASLVTAFAGIIVGLVNLIPDVGRLRRLERVVTILEKVNESEARLPLLALRDRLIAGLDGRRRLRTTLTVTGVAFLLCPVVATVTMAIVYGDLYIPRGLIAEVTWGIFSVDIAGIALLVVAGVLAPGGIRRKRRAVPSKTMGGRESAPEHISS